MYTVAADCIQTWLRPSEKASAQLLEPAPAKASLQAQVYGHLLGAIIRLELAPGERLVESHLAAQLGVSRLPIREALHRLERERLVMIRPHRGAVVAPLTARNADEVYALRIALETLAARLAAENASGAEIRAMEAAIADAAPAIAAGRYQAVYESGAVFHAQVVAASENRMLAAVLEMIEHHIARLRTLQARSTSQTIAEQAQESHLAIYHAIAQRRSDLAARLMEEHVTQARDRIIPLLAPTNSGMIEQVLSPFPSSSNGKSTPIPE